MARLFLTIMVLLLAAGSGAEEQFGLTESQRQQVFRDLGAAENRAEREAAQKFEADPESQGQFDFTMRLKAEYRSEIARKYGLTEDQLVVIDAEGYEKGWSEVGAPPEVEEQP